MICNMAKGNLSNGTFLKNFIDWFRLKPRLDLIKISPNFSEREVWNCHFGVNIGYEMDGKNLKFIRPVLVYKKLNHNSFIGIPLTSKLKNGSWYYPSFIQGVEGRYILSQIRVFDSKRLYNRLERVYNKDFKDIQKNLLSFLG